jgi:crotonobetainyl-CoA:carnitine CoA-transferase CaiB-like acyl-CoA transferase
VRPRLNAAGAPCGAYATAKEALAHPHLAARGSFAELEDADGAFKVLSPPFGSAALPPLAASWRASASTPTKCWLSSPAHRARQAEPRHCART